MTTTSNDPFSVFEMVATGSNYEPSPIIDWSDIKGEIVGRLGVAAEFETLGVRFSSRTPTAKGWLECHAIDRPDDTPSAAVHLDTGVYVDRGGDGANCHLFDFAMRHGKFGRWIDVVRHYAEKAGVSLKGVRADAKGRVLEKVYEYRDEENKVRYGVHRYRLANGKKDFRQYPWKNGGWVKESGCMEGVPPLPYRLPQLLASPRSAPVYVVEGEKDADRLASLGLVATTNHQGAMSTDITWPYFLEYFRGRTIVILPDNDPGGKQHASKVAAHLTGLAASVKVVPLPGVPLKGDVSDWLDRGEDASTLATLAAETAEWTRETIEAGDRDPGADAHVGDLRAYLLATPWVWPLWIPGAALTLLAASGGTGKTRLCFDLHRRIYHGLPWPDGTPATLPPGGPLLWVAADNQHQELADLAREFGIPDEAVRLNTTVGHPFDGTQLETIEELADLEARIVRIKPALVVIDTITNTSDRKSQDSADAKMQYKPLQEIALRTGTAILCVTHLNAEGKVLGRRAVEKVRVVIQMEYPDPDGQVHRRKLHVTKSKAIRPKPLGVTMGDDGNEYDFEPPDSASPEGINPKAFARGKVDGHKGQAPAKISAAMDWLAALVGAGDKRVSALRNQWDEEARGSIDTLYKAKDRLGLVEYQDDRGKKWWAAPDAHNPTRNGTNLANPGSPF